MEIEIDIGIPMRDGIRLSANLYRPIGDGPFPVVLNRTPYGKAQTEIPATFLSQQGYVIVAQDVRGRYDSEGEFYPLVNEPQDGYDTLEWIGVQPWCDGNVGMMGGSYEGWVQWAAATQGSSYLKTIMPGCICTDWYKDNCYSGGAFQLSVGLMWRCFTTGRINQILEHYRWSEIFKTLPLRDMEQWIGGDVTFFQDWLSHPTYDDYWKALAINKEFSKIKIPVFQIGGWYDIFAGSVLPIYNQMKGQDGDDETKAFQKVIVGPWIHDISSSTHAGDIDFGMTSVQDLLSLTWMWFERWLKRKETPVTEEPPIKLFVMGINEWRDEHEWPLARTEFTPYYLHSAGSANSLHGDGVLSLETPEEEPADQFTYDPMFPVSTTGGGNCCWPDIVAWGAQDQREVEQRSDVLCYTTPPLDDDLETTGPIKVTLHAVSDAPDTDFTAKLVDVAPGGYAMNICDGIIRARYRESVEQPVFLEPGKVYKYEIDLGATSKVFLKDHRIRLEISSSNFPRFDRNPNTGHEFAADAETRSAHQQVYHNEDYPSHIILPVIPKK
jgi:putative CocE/NonD family hydrolase